MTETIENLVSYLESYLKEDQLEQIEKAYYFAEEAHKGQRRLSGEPYITHPLAVAFILAKLHMDHQSIVSAILHDVIEDTGISKGTIEIQFDATVADIVDGVSKLTNMKFEDKKLAQAENFQKMALAMARDIRVILVKLADRLHNVRTLGSLNYDKQRRIARETLDIYAPISQRLGIDQMRVEFEERSFKAMFPLRSTMLERAVSSVRGDRSILLQKIINKISQSLQSKDIKAQVRGREKHLYSIYKKMKNQNKSFSDIMDVFGVRIILESVDDCYLCLGLVHSLYKPIPGRFKDYIAIPKANGYGSLHTTLFGSQGIPVEVQIRTQKMEDMANNGIASHWLYKTGDEALSGTRYHTRIWLQNVMELLKNAGNSLEFIEHIKMDLFPDDTYVFTTDGEILELPRGATSVDFAYAVHTMTGNTCIACRIDKKLASLSQPLESGQTVEIVTSPGSYPSASWLKFAKSSKARSNIHHYLKNLRRSESISLGKRLLKRTLMPMGYTIRSIKKTSIDRTLKSIGLSSMDDVFSEIGLGNRMAYIVAKHLIDNTDSYIVNKAIPELSLKGTEKVVIKYASCCLPIPGDPIIGHILEGEGLEIHNAACKRLIDIRKEPNKILEINWDKDITGQFYVELDVSFKEEDAMIANLATTIANCKAAIERVSVEEQNAHLNKAKILIKVNDRTHLAKVIKQIRAITNITSISRTKIL